MRGSCFERMTRNAAIAWPISVARFNSLLQGSRARCSRLASAMAMACGAISNLGRRGTSVVDGRTSSAKFFSGLASLFAPRTRGGIGCSVAAAMSRSIKPQGPQRAAMAPGFGHSGHYAAENADAVRACIGVLLLNDDLLRWNSWSVLKKYFNKRSRERRDHASCSVSMASANAGSSLTRSTRPGHASHGLRPKAPAPLQCIMEKK